MLSGFLKKPKFDPYECNLKWVEYGEIKILGIVLFNDYIHTQNLNWIKQIIQLNSSLELMF